GTTQMPAPGCRIEREPAEAVEPDFDPSVRVSVGDLPEIVVVTPREEAGRHAGRDPEEPQHHRHRTGEVLAVPALRSDDEADEWWESRRGAGVLGVRETSGRRSEERRVGKECRSRGWR